MREHLGHSGLSVYFRRHFPKINAEYIRRHCIVEQIAAFGGGHTASGGVSVVKRFDLLKAILVVAADTPPIALVMFSRTSVASGNQMTLPN
jgi:hypothetical protein